MFQFSPGLSTGRNLECPESDRAEVLFQFSPGLSTGRNIWTCSTNPSRSRFQSSPGLSTGRNPASAAPTARALPVPILARPLDRAQRVRGADEGQALYVPILARPLDRAQLETSRVGVEAFLFQSSPGLSTGRNLSGSTPLGRNSTVPILARPLDRAQPMRLAGTLSRNIRSNPRPASRPGATCWSWRSVRRGRCSNPRPASRPGATAMMIALCGNGFCPVFARTLPLRAGTRPDRERTPQLAF